VSWLEDERRGLNLSMGRCKALPVGARKKLSWFGEYVRVLETQMKYRFFKLAIRRWV
jgi:hypothetical protein